MVQRYAASLPKGGFAPYRLWCHTINIECYEGKLSSGNRRSGTGLGNKMTNKPIQKLSKDNCDINEFHWVNENCYSKMSDPYKHVI